MTNSPISAIDAKAEYFLTRGQIALAHTCADWDITLADGPVVATAIHDGHAIRDVLRPMLAIDDAQRLREEDPLTGVLTRVGDVRVQVRTSRFEVDLNRPRERAVYARPEDAWGLQAWRAPLPPREVEQSRAAWDRFYAMVTELLDRLLARWDAVLLIDLHSYNHRRDGPDQPPAAQDGNPDIELGFTTADPARWRATCERFAQALRQTPIHGATPDVRANVRFPTGGHFPEWVYAQWGDRVCTISPEYKKIFMDEWTGQADIAALDALQRGLQHAVDVVRPEFRRRR
ncbi:N-formylglutamate amidohydrolase [Luteimonas aestuarii]|uniref:N-formylglutamate amidohydrolase n=1 Tax=Luteimonas aestuarii TaxID=453837 RepID=A0A4R5U3V7_9GAMM|nr:N-formylglutamate amidohydrolase [Luteimonas aestuarii]TDK28390.1 N-formylglutamate amidohydrolase [Luteimonas aestuarii]